MNGSRNESVNSITIVKSSMNMYATPAHTNLVLTPAANVTEQNKEDRAPTRNKIQTAIADASGKEDLSNTRLEFRLKIKDLENLKQAFDNFQLDKDKTVQLSKEDFVRFLNINLNKGTDQEYEELFDNIDVTQSGYVDWDKFTSYILIMLYESDDRIKAFSIPNWKPIKNIQNVHRDSIRRIEYIKNIGRYLTISKEGSCCMFDRNSNLTNNARVNTESCKSKDLWVTDFTVLQNINKIVLAFTTKEIAIYELTTKLDFNCHYRIHSLKAIPLCLDYWYDPSNPNDSILLWGDTIGFVHSIHFNSTTIALFERPASNVNAMKTQQSTSDTSLDININEIKDKYKNAMYIHFKAHSGWCRQVKWIKNLDCIVSCATTNKQSVCMGWFVKKSAHIRVTYFNVINGGVNSFDYDPKLNLIATANQNTLVNLFNPYVNEPNGILKGHSRVVLAVKFMPSRSQLISFSADKILRIWNVPLQICIQRVANVFPKGPEVDVTCWFDEHANRFYISFRYILMMMEIKPEITNRVMSHNNTVVAAKFNKNSNQVVTLSQDGTIYMWLIESGQKIKTFTELHGQAEVTSLTFDETNTRIYTASTDGTVKIWDFNGHCYHTLQANDGQNCEIAQILSIKRRVLAMGFSKSLTVFRDNMFKEHNVKPSDWKGGEIHHEDILCAAIMKIPPLYLATASFDGDIVIWNSVTELPYKQLTARKRVNTHKIQKENTTSSTRTNRSSKIARIASKNDITEAASDPENDFGNAITCLKFLNKRIYCKDSNLMSCGGNGWLRFWEISNGKLVAEFQAHTHVSSIIMEVDESEQYLATGDVNGIVKIWNISDYCLNVNPNDNILTTEPNLVTIIQSHNDVINSLDFCVKNDKIFVLIASSDCSVTLNDLNGNLIGTFGQETHWKIELSPNSHQNDNVSILNKLSYEANAETHIHEHVIDLENNQPDKFEIEIPKQSMDENNQEEFSESLNNFNSNQENFLPQLSKKLTIEPTFKFEQDAFINNTSLRYNPWSKTILGKSYQECRVKKRERRQPGTINSEEYMIWDKTGQAPGGLYGSLEIVELETLKNEPKKDVLLNPHKFFKERNAHTLIDLKPHKSLAESLRTAFDEKTLFPKYILDYEARVRQENKALLAKLNKETETSISNQKKREKSGSVM